MHVAEKRARALLEGAQHRRPGRMRALESERQVEGRVTAVRVMMRVPGAGVDTAPTTPETEGPVRLGGDCLHDDWMRE